MASPVLDPQIDPTNEQPATQGPLEQLGYNGAPTPAERKLEIEQPDNDQNSPARELAEQKIDELKKQKVEEVKTRLKSGVQKLTKSPATPGAAGQLGAKGSKSTATGTGRRAVAEGAKKAGQAIAQGAKQVGKQLLAAGEKFVAANPEIWIPIGIILVIILIIGLVIAIFAFSRSSGGGPPNYPSTQVEKSQAGLLAAFSGDKLMQFSIVKDVVESETKRYEKIAQLMQTNPGGAAITTSSADVQKVQADLDQVKKLITAQDRAGTTLALKSAIDNEKKVEAGLPFGAWIATIAKGFADPSSQYHQDTQVCHIVNIKYTEINNGRRGCALIVSVALNLAAVPQDYVLATQTVWDNPIYSTVVARPAALNRDLAKNSLATLKPGDIVWWGNGSSNNNGSLFNHIGIYIGNDQAVNNSSSKASVVITPLDRSDTIFNGAKRYAP